MDTESVQLYSINVLDTEFLEPFTISGLKPATRLIWDITGNKGFISLGLYDNISQVITAKFVVEVKISTDASHEFDFQLRIAESAYHETGMMFTKFLSEQTGSMVMLRFELDEQYFYDSLLPLSYFQQR